MSKRQPIFYSAILLTAVNLLLRFTSTSFQVYISGRIGAAGVGLLHLVLSVGAMAMTAGVAGVRTTTMYLTAAELGKKHPENVYHVLSVCMLYSILCSSIAAICLFSFSDLIAVHWIGDSKALQAIRLLAVFLPVNCLCGVMTGYFTAAGRITTLVAVEVAEQIISMTITMVTLTLWANHDSAKACLSVILGSGIGACLTLVILTLLRILERAKKGNPFPLRKRLLDIAIPLAIADDLKTGINTTENLIVPKRLALWQGCNDPLALFGTVCAMVFPVLMFPAAIVFSLAELLIPEMARCHAAGSIIRIQYLSKRSLHIVLIYGCLISGLLFFLAYPLCQVLYDNTSAGFYLSIYAFLAPMLYCDIIIDAINKGLGQQKISVRYNIFTALLDLLLLFFLLPKYGMMGYFIGFLITHLINFILSLRLLMKSAKITPSTGRTMQTILCMAIAILLASFVSIPILQCICFILSFGSLLTLCRITGIKDLLWIRNLIIRK